MRRVLRDMEVNVDAKNGDTVRVYCAWRSQRHAHELPAQLRGRRVSNEASVRGVWENADTVNRGPAGALVAAISSYRPVSKSLSAMTPSAAHADSAQARKARGTFFTPPELCDYVVDWAVRDGHDIVLEPSCGEAAFLLTAGARLRTLNDGGHYGPSQLCGLELHEQSARAARLRLASLDLGAQIEIGDFFAADPAPRFDAVVGNPPYVHPCWAAGSFR